MSEATHPQSNGTLAGAAESEQQLTRPRTELLELARPECLRLLATTSIGRVVVSVPAWDHPMIRPVNYLFDESSQSVLLRSAIGSKLHSLLRSARAAFEIDGIDHAGDVGWSVIITGVCEEITAPPSCGESRLSDSSHGRRALRATGSASVRTSSRADGS